MLNYEEYEPEAPEFGCLRTILAYAAAVYVLAATLPFSEPNPPEFVWILISPLIFPLAIVLGFAASGNSEAGPAVGAVAMMLLVFLVAFAMMLWTIRQSQKRPEFGWLLGGAVFALLLISYCKTG